MDWDKLRVFHAVALAKSLTKAGDMLKLSQSATSRQISALEEQLGIALFHRHTRGLVLTEQGEILFRTVADMATKLQATEISLTDSSAKPRGPFRLTVTADFGGLWLAGQMREFTELYPEILLTLVSEDRELDLIARQADAAIRFHESHHPDLVQIPIFTMRNALFASNDYLLEHGTPTTVKELEHHRLIAFDATTNNMPSPEVNWLFEGAGAHFKPYFRANSLMAVRTAVKTGMGIAVLPEYMVHRARRITRVLPEHEGPLTQAWYVYPVELKNSKRIAVFRNYIAQKVAEANF